MLRKRAWFGVLAVLVAAGSLAASATADKGGTATPIKHLVVIFQENVSFDHYFGTYPVAANSDGQPFLAPDGTPAVDGLTPATDKSIPVSLRHSTDLTASNPNSSLPARLDSTPLGKSGSPGGQITCDQDHNYSDEQQAFDGGAMDQFVQSVGGTSFPPPGVTCHAAAVMDYYDGNTVTGFWNYAKRFAMSDNSFSPTFGPSSPGAVNLVSGDTGNVDMTHAVNSPSIATSSAPNADLTADGLGGYSLTSDAQPCWDDCSTRDAVALNGQNIGDELNAAGLSWGWFQGGLRPTVSYAQALMDVGASGQSTSTFTPDQFKAFFSVAANRPAHSTNQGNCDNVTPIGVALGFGGAEGYKDDYIPHHEPFQYYVSTANPHHLPPANLAAIGTDTQSYVSGAPQFNTANHQYDMTDFDSLVAAINGGSMPASALPAVSFLKAPGYEDGHAAYSDPADEQQFVVREINALEAGPDWSSTAVVVAYDDSDGWYDHVYSGVTNPSASVADNLTNSVLKLAAGTSGLCGAETPAFQPLAREQGRCGFGPRQPFLVISPCAASDTVDHNVSDLASVPNFIEYNWHLPSIAGSFDQALAGTDKSEKVAFDLAGLFDLKCRTDAVKLDPNTGQVDDRGADLSSRNMQGGDLSGAELNDADLDGANLQKSFLPNANLTGALVRGTNLQNADLAGANLTNADLRGSNLQKSDLTNANLTGANLAGANIQNVTWSNTTCPDGTNSNADGGSCKGHT
ncbi:MAG TPA: alkaline phosphatase family protein [Gaiellaceae bacterium]|nr:alkaline phosphatase family protein [Gaiellaceae bacterium]